MWVGKPAPWPGAVSGGTGGTWLVLAVAGCCRNPGGAEVPVDAGIELGSTTKGVGIGVGCATIPLVESGTTGFGTGVPVSGEGAASAVSSSLGAIDVSSLEAEVPGGLVHGLWPGCDRQRLGITDGQSVLLALVRIVGI